MLETVTLTIRWVGLALHGPFFLTLDFCLFSFFFYRKELAIVHPNLRGGAESAAYVNVDPTTIPGIYRAKQMGLVESGLAEVRAEGRRGEG